MDAARFLIESGCKVGARLTDGRTALHIAASYNYVGFSLRCLLHMRAYVMCVCRRHTVFAQGDCPALVYILFVLLLHNTRYFSLDYSSTLLLQYA